MASSEFNQLPSGLCNAPATFSRLMDRTLSGLAWNICLYYLDDIIVFSATWAEHLERLRAVFERLRRANLKLGAHKCHLAVREVNFLGYKVTPEGLEPEPRLMEAISKLPPPINVAEVRSFLGLIGYYRRFVKKFSDKAGLVALHRFRLSNLYNINSLASPVVLLSLSSQMAIVCVQAI